MDFWREQTVTGVKSSMFSVSYVEVTLNTYLMLHRLLVSVITI